METEPAGADASGGGAPSDPLAVVATFGDPVEASILRGRLEQAGIEACVPEELSATAFGGLPLNPVTVRVAQQDLAAAQAILAASTEA